MMRLKKIFFHLAIAGLATLAGKGSVMAADITVCPSGCNYTTVQAGLNAALSGDRVLVGTPGRLLPEVYSANILMKGGVSLVSEGGDSQVDYTDPLGGTGHTRKVLKRATLTILRGNGNDPVVLFPMTLTTPSLLDGFIVENIDASAPDWTGLIQIGGSSPTIQNNIVRDNQGVAHNGGITTMGEMSTAMPLIQNNVIHYVNGPGIGVRQNSAPTIIGNDIFTTPPTTGDYSPGIGLMDDARPTILNNRIFRSGRAGIGSLVYGVRNSGFPIVIKGNTIYDNAPIAGIRITGQSGSTGVDIQIGGPNAADSNEFYNNRAGVYLDHQDPHGRMGSALIENNSFHDNGIAVYAKNTLAVTIKNNTMNNQFFGCAVRAGENDEVIVRNNIMDNNANCGFTLFQSSIAVNLIIENNHISNNGFAGIRLDNTGTTGVVRGNRITQNARAGIVITSEMTLEIMDNEIDHNIRGGIHTGLDLNNGGGFIGIPGQLHLTVRGNKVHNNGQAPMGGGIDVRHASGTIENNLVYKNSMGGIRFGDWIGAINHNTVVGNGMSGMGGGIIFDDLHGAVGEVPPQGSPTEAIPIINNIIADNTNAGINAGTRYSGGGTCYMWAGFRQYNLLSGNNGAAVSCPGFSPWCKRPQLAMCNENTGEIFASPTFVDGANDDYRLQDLSPAVDSGDPAFPDDAALPPGVGTPAVDMGAYGGQYGINW
ncbi:MAG: right-handed parallel beta-helix repeat-containing protein [Deltaproteobacteria bacterium]|nr:right-handed parallel beta-helix repeat-containing protein [Deltaproteobacteria bacterium]